MLLKFFDFETIYLPYLVAANESVCYAITTTTIASASLHLTPITSSRWSPT